MESIGEKILRLKKEKNAVIMAHNYTMPDVQDVSDYVGDSLGLSRAASKTDSDVIVFCGVSFMGKPPKSSIPIKSPASRTFGGLFHGIHVHGFANTRTEESISRSCGGCLREHNGGCESRSGHMLHILEFRRGCFLARRKEILFVPDANLADYTARHVSGKKIIPFRGYCSVHHGITVWQIRDLLSAYPDSEIISHPECRTEVLDISDFVGSTEKMIDYVKNSSGSRFIVATDSNMAHRIKKERKDAELFFPPNPVCHTMRMFDSRSVLKTLEEEKHEVVLDPAIMEKARRPVERMLSVR